MSDYPPRLERLAHMARQRPTLLAGLLAIYQEQEDLTAGELADFLEGDIEALTPLSLCRCPRMEPGRFQSDVAQIADYAHVKATQLAKLIQTATRFDQPREGNAPPLLRL